MEVILGEKTGIPCPICDSPLISITGSRIHKCQACNLENSESQLREYWEFL